MSELNGVKVTPRKVIQKQYRERKKNLERSDRGLAQLARELVMLTREMQEKTVWIEIPQVSSDPFVAMVQLTNTFREALAGERRLDESNDADDPFAEFEPIEVTIDKTGALARSEQK